MRLFITLALLFASITSFAGTVYHPTPGPAVHPTQAAPDNMDGDTIFIGTALGTAACDVVADKYLGDHKLSMLACGLGALAINAQRNKSNMDAAFLGTAAGTGFVYTWKFK